MFVLPKFLLFINFLLYASPLLSLGPATTRKDGSQFAVGPANAAVG
jgi:hypothetical protein